MKRRPRIEPVDVSKSLFMDLAFLLIGALVLVVSESDRRDADAYRVAGQRVRSVVVQPETLVESDGVEGESLYLAISSSGRIAEVRQDETEVSLERSGLAARVAQMSSAGARAVVLIPDWDTPYSVVADVRDVLEGLRRSAGITSIYELVRRKS